MNALINYNIYQKFKFIYSGRKVLHHHSLRAEVMARTGDKDETMVAIIVLSWMKESNPIQLNTSNRDVGNLSAPFFWRNTKLMPPNSISISGQYSENGRRIERAQRRIEWEHFKHQEDERWKLNWQESLINTFDEWRAGDLVGRNSDEIEWLCSNRELSDNNIIIIIIITYRFVSVCVQFDIH